MGFESLRDCFQDATIRGVTVVMCDNVSSIVINKVGESIDDVLDAVYSGNGLVVNSASSEEVETVLGGPKAA